MRTSFWKITIISIFFTQITQAWHLWSFCGSYDKHIIVDGSNVTELFKHPDCLVPKPTNGTTVYVHGFTGSPNDKETLGFIRTYLSVGGKNVILLDWSREAAGPAIRYPVAVTLIYTVGFEVAVAFSKLFNHGLDIATVRFISLSLGVHLAGRIGAALKVLGSKLPRISGLDPAGLGSEIIPLPHTISQNDAEFVDILHTDPCKYGMKTPRGHFDCYVNYGAFRVCNRSSVQCGCPVGEFPLLSPEDGCSHIRSLYLDEEALLKPDGLIASKAKDYDTWVSNNGALNEITVIGEYMDLSRRGKYFMSTNCQPDYGKGLDGLKPNNE